MKITKTTIKKVTGSTSLRAYASLEFDNTLVVTGFSIFDSVNGLFVSMPQRKSNDKYYDVVYPTSKRGREFISKHILAEYDKSGERTEDQSGFSK